MRCPSINEDEVPGALRLLTNAFRNVLINVPSLAMTPQAPLAPLVAVPVPETARRGCTGKKPAEATREKMKNMAQSIIGGAGAAGPRRQVRLLETSRGVTIEIAGFGIVLCRVRRCSTRIQFATARSRK